MRRIAIMLSCCLALFSCQNLSKGGAMQRASAPVSSTAAAVIATDLANRLSERLPVAENPIFFAKDPSEFGSALRLALKNAGYTVAIDTKAGAKAVPVSYRLDISDAGVLTTLATDDLRLSRRFDLSEKDVVAAGPLSVMALK